jgi:hypothetical protein
MISGRRGHPADRARLRSDSGRSRPRHQAARSPTRLLPAAQPRLGCCPPRTAVPAGDHHPIPGLNDVAERPQIPGRSHRVHRLVQLLLEPATVGVSQDRAHQLDPLRQVRAGRPFSLSGS